jgi:hypothetical protein
MKNLYLKALILIIVVGILYSTDAVANDKIKHGAVAAGLSAGLTYACKRRLKDKWFCWWSGVIVTTMAGMALEMAQNDIHDAGGDMAANMTGAVLGASIVIPLD